MVILGGTRLLGCIICLLGEEILELDDGNFLIGCPLGTGKTILEELFNLREKPPLN